MKENSGSYSGSNSEIAIYYWTIHIKKYGRTIRLM